MRGGERMAANIDPVCQMDNTLDAAFRPGRETGELGTERRRTHQISDHSDNGPIRVSVL